MKKCIKCGVFLAMPMSDYCTNCNPSNIDVSQGQIGKGPQQQTQNIQHQGLSIGQQQSQEIGGTQQQSFSSNGNIAKCVTGLNSNLDDTKNAQIGVKSVIGERVFICYSSKDQKLANIVCQYLEENKIRCWIAPRDITSGSYAQSIVEAIENSILIVLIFTNNINSSNHVKRELELAVKNGVSIQPFKTEKVEPIKELEYYISSSHCLEALTMPLDAHLAQLVKNITPLFENK